MMALKQHYDGRVAFIIADLENPQSSLFLEDFNIYYIPDFYFINSAGVVVLQEAGVFSYEEMLARVNLIADQGSSADDDSDRELGGLEKFIRETLPAVIGERSFAVLALVFFGGIVTSISPCVLTMVPLLVGYIGGYGEGGKFKGLTLSFSFVSGMAITFALLGYIAAFFGRVFGQFDSAWYFVLAAVAIIMGLQLVGVFNFTLPGLKKMPIRKTGPGGAVLMGLLFGLVASPCATPVLAVIITYAAVQAEPFYGSALLFIYGLGHGLPLLVAGTFTGMARNLSAINRYTHYLSYISGITLVIAGLALLYWVTGI